MYKLVPKIIEKIKDRLLNMPRDAVAADRCMVDPGGVRQAGRSLRL